MRQSLYYCSILICTFCFDCVIAPAAPLPTSTEPRIQTFSVAASTTEHTIKASPISGPTATEPTASEGLRTTIGVQQEPNRVTAQAYGFTSTAEGPTAASVSDSGNGEEPTSQGSQYRALTPTTHLNANSSATNATDVSSLSTKVH